VPILQAVMAKDLRIFSLEGCHWGRAWGLDYKNNYV